MTDASATLGTAAGLGLVALAWACAALRDWLRRRGML